MGGPAQNAGQPNVYQQAATGMQTAGTAAANVAGFQPGQLSSTNFQPYMNPYTQNVINQGASDIQRQQAMSQNALGAQATAAGAFGGSRHGVAEGQMMGDYGRTFADFAANQRQQAFNNAQQAAQFDIGQQMAGAQTQLAGAGALGNLSNLGFGMGQQINAGLSGYGAEQRGIEQQVLDNIRSQFQGYTGAPQQGLASILGAVGGVPYSTTSTTKQSPGLLGILGALTGM